jgi:DNA end-binding protein Ku
VRPKEEELAERLIGELSTDAFHPEKYHDEYQERLLGAIERKVEGREITAPPAEPRAQVIDLFEALERSLKGKTKVAEAEPAQAEEAAAASETRPALKKAAPRRASREKKAG